MKKLIVALAMTFLMVMAIDISYALAEPKPKEGNPGLPGCLATVDQQAQIISVQNSTILVLQDQIKELQELLDAMKNYAPVHQTGQAQSYYPGDDGSFQTGVPWPNPRFTDQTDGTVKDNLTGLIWMKDANCDGTKTWTQAVDYCSDLTNDMCGLSDGSVAGDWRLPTALELASLIHWGFWNPALPNIAGTGQLSQGDPFLNVVTAGQCFYFTSTTYLFHNTSDTQEAWTVPMSSGGIVNQPKGTSYYVWCVRNAQ